MLFRSGGAAETEKVGELQPYDPKTNRRASRATYVFRQSPLSRAPNPFVGCLEGQEWVDLIHSGYPPAMAAICGYCSLMGQGARGSSGVDAFGCRRSLRARSALDGVSWVPSGSVEIAVGQNAPATQSTPSSAPSLGRRSSWELVSASCLVACRA